MNRSNWYDWIAGVARELGAPPCRFLTNPTAGLAWSRNLSPAEFAAEWKTR